MEPVVSAGTQPVHIPDTPAPSTSLVKSMVYQCLSPITAELPEEVIRRTRDIESEQRRLIAQLEQNVTDNSRSNGNLPAVGSGSPQVAQSQRNPLTPPSSTTSTPHKSNQFPPDSPIQTTSRCSSGAPRSRSFGGRRSRRPRELDLDALRRERQFSGPYSANPLLPRKRRTQSAEATPGRSEAETPKRLRPPLELEPLEPEPNSSSRNVIRLPLISHMTTAPYVANGSIRTPDMIWPPLCSPSTRTLPSSAHQLTTLRPRRNTSVDVSPSSDRFNELRSSKVSPSQSDGNVSPGAERLMNEAQQDSSLQSKSKQASNCDRQSENNTQSNSQVTPEAPETTSHNDRKARYMQLCSEMWDLLHN